MSLLSYTELLELQKKGYIKNSLPEHVNGSSIDVTLGSRILVELGAGRAQPGAVYLKNRDALQMKEVELSNAGHYMLRPGEFVLAQTQQVFNLPNWMSAEYKMKSSMARVGLTNLLAGWCDPGWHDSVLTLELVNSSRYHSIFLQLGDRIGQVVFFQHTTVPEWASYAKRGRYNNDSTVQGVKP